MSHSMIATYICRTAGRICICIFHIRLFYIIKIIFFEQKTKNAFFHYEIAISKNKIYNSLNVQVSNKNKIKQI